MTYGTPQAQTYAYIRTRAEQSNISVDQLGIMPCMSVKGDEDDERWEYCMLPFNHEGVDEYEPQPDNLFTFSVIVDGALDEEWNARTIYEVNIADWIKELLDQELDVHEGETADYLILVTRYAFNDVGEQVYRISSHDD